MTEQPRCRTCQRPIYYSAERDHVGRATSNGRWVHYGEADHDAAPEGKR